MSEPLFSIILPSHNGQEYIRTAITSVTNQAFRDYELIVVCDACTDNTESIARGYTGNVINVNCRRDGLARNAGIEVARGKWILFLDDDDYFLHEYTLQELANMIGKHDEDLLLFSFIWKGIGYARQTPEDHFVMAWCKCYRREFIGSTRFSDKEYGSDVGFHYDLMSRKPTIVFRDIPLYYYNYMRPGSMTDRETRKHG